MPQLPDAPAGKTVHVPSALAPSACRHTLHPPVHALLQHTPSAHCPETHWAPLVHGAPACCRAVHAPAVQGMPGAHWAALVQEVGQVAAPPQA